MSSELYARQRGGLIAEVEFWASAAPGGRGFAQHGVVASIVSVTPDRSIFNSVVSETLDGLRSVYDELARAYREAGVRAFTVWTDPGDEATPAFLAERGHVLDASPRAMATPLAELSLPDPGDLDHGESSDLAAIAELCDAAFGLEPPAFRAALVHVREGSPWRAHLARSGGRAVAGLATAITADGDCVVSCVATLAEARGQGLASRLLAVALRRARDEGATTTSLQATTKGRGVYERLGYRDLGAMGMWEHRTPKPA